MSFQTAMQFCKKMECFGNQPLSFFLFLFNILKYTNASAYGSVVGSCAMAFLPTGGLYITGGLLRNLLGTTPDRSTDATSTGNENCSEMSTLSHNSSSVLTLFMNAYRSKGPASFLLNDIPLYMVQAKDTGLRGAAVRAEMVRGINILACSY